MGKMKLDKVDHQILSMLIENSRVAFTDIAKELDVSPGTIHVRVKKLEETGIINGCSLKVDYERMGYNFIAFVGIFIKETSQIKFVVERLKTIPHVTIAHLTTGKFNIFCKIRAKDTSHAKEVLFNIVEIDGVSRTETIVSLEESINDSKRLLRYIIEN